MAMLKEYFEIYTEKIKEYGEKTAILIQNGAFFECYQKDEHYLDSEKIGNANIIARILNNMKYTGKYFGKSVYINFMGFTSSSLDKYLTLLLNANYTVIIVRELESSSETKGNLKRGITNIYSPSLQPIENESQNLLCILINIFDSKSSNKKNSVIINNFNSSICCVNNGHNTIELTENIFNFNLNDTTSLSLCLDDIERIIYKYFPKELNIKIRIDDKSLFLELKTIKDFFYNNYENVTINLVEDTEYKKYIKTDNQNTFLKNMYKYVNFANTEPIEYFNLNNYSLSTINLIYTIEFISKHDLSYIENLSFPKMILENNNLILELNTISQLNIITDKTSSNKVESVFDVINHTRTVIGKRSLINLLCKPFKCQNIIEKRYNTTDEIEKLQELQEFKKLNDLLSNIIDFEKLHRKMGLQLLHPYEFEILNSNYNTILKIIDIFKKSNYVELLSIIPKEHELHLIDEYIKEYSCIFNMDKLRGIELNTTKDDIINYFNLNVIPELDIIQKNIENQEINKEKLRLIYDSKINKNSDIEMIKLVYSENDGYEFTCTKIRFKLLQEKMLPKENQNEKISNSCVKFCPNELYKLSLDLVNQRKLLHAKIKSYYIKYIKYFYLKYNSIFDVLKEFIEIVDVCNSNLKCKQKYNYTRPKITKTDDSFLEAIQLRHPIIERLGKNYIPNDISLNNEKCGILLYGLNSSGKSSMLRAIGVNIILAQCGLFVPCKSLEYYPFDTIISQVDLTDNLFSGKSSFITEMTGLKTILKCSGKNTLCLADEVLKGTETNSAMGLIVSMILKLTNDNTKFFLTSHLHEIPKIQEIKEIVDLKLLQIKHLGVSTINNNIIYNRILEDGSGSQLYGIEVAKNILQNNEFIDTAFKIRNNLVKKIPIIKKSVYNRKKTVDKCEICSSLNNLETDHIKEQQTADINGFVPDGYHKNEVFNLAILCKSCHLKKTQGIIIINGYKDSINGRFLDVIHNNKN